MSTQTATVNKTEKRGGVAVMVPEWNAETCAQCNQCSFVCPHATIRPYLLTEEEAANAPEGAAIVDKKAGKGKGVYKYTLAVSDKDKLGSAVAEIVDLENDISEMISQALERRRQITTEISNLQNKNQYDILYKRYVLRKDWNLICVEMGYSFRNVMSIHGKALKSFEKLFGEKYLAQKCT